MANMTLAASDGLAQRAEAITQDEMQQTSSVPEVTEIELIFSELKDFKVGELSRLCISRDFFS